MSAGSRLGSYEIVGLIGAGGMGDVYRARDEKLRRDVAIKVLPELFANDPDRVARFNREAQAVAALNHPNVGATVLKSGGNARGKDTSLSPHGLTRGRCGYCDTWQSAALFQA